MPVLEQALVDEVANRQAEDHAMDAKAREFLDEMSEQTLQMTDEREQ